MALYSPRYTTIGTFVAAAKGEINRFLEELESRPSNTIPGLVSGEDKRFEPIMTHRKFDTQYYENVPAELQQGVYYPVKGTRHAAFLSNGTVIIDVFLLDNGYAVLAINNEVVFVRTPEMQTRMASPVEPDEGDYLT